ncbi:MAG: hypothetical protein JXR91_13555 [Deltaproteobacteria bacterium]|nr:hypothetical protein [Deltaproteobacteria bacterium]
MGKIKDNILSKDNRPKAIKECARLVDEEVASKKGMTGIIIKTGYKTFKAIKPSIVEIAVDVLLDDFASKLDEQYDEYLKDSPDKAKPFDQWAKMRDKKIADALLNVTDNMMERSKKEAIKRVYKSLRGIAEKNVAAAVPQIGKLVMKYAD